MFEMVKTFLLHFLKAKHFETMNFFHQKVGLTFPVHIYKTNVEFPVVCVYINIHTHIYMYTHTQREILHTQSILCIITEKDI